jgi:hypothetical protein
VRQGIVQLLFPRFTDSEDAYIESASYLHAHASHVHRKRDDSDQRDRIQQEALLQCMRKQIHDNDYQSQYVLRRGNPKAVLYQQGMQHTL